MKIFSSFSNISGWYRLLIVASVIWFLFSLVFTDPWTHKMPDFMGGYTENNWDQFLTIGIAPLIIFWGLIWIVCGFKKDKTLPRKQS
jgi:hypothetical protein